MSEVASSPVPDAQGSSLALVRSTALLGAEHPVRVAIARELTAVEVEFDTAAVDARLGRRP